RLASCSTTAEWITPRSGGSSRRTRASSSLMAALSVTSAAAARTCTPRRSGPASAPGAPGGSRPRRPVKAGQRAPACARPLAAAAQLIQIEAVVGQVVQERQQGDRAVLQVVAFAQLKEASERPEQGQAAHHCLAGQRVENDVDPLAGRGRANLVHEGQRSTVE